MCLRMTEEGHRRFSATLAIAEDKTRSLAERQKACCSLLSTGIVGTTQPMGIDLEPPCQLLSKGKNTACVLWKEELSPQAQRELSRRAAEDAPAIG